MIEIIITHTACFALGIGLGIIYGARLGIEEFAQAIGVQFVEEEDDAEN